MLHCVCLPPLFETGVFQIVKQEEPGRFYLTGVVAHTMSVQ
jgi:hypothetical protein